MRRGFFFSTDAFLAGALFITALLLIIQFPPLTQPTQQLDYAASDTLNALASLRVEELNHTYIDELIADGLVNDTSVSVLYQIGELWALGETVPARNLTIIALNTTIPSRYGFRLSVGGDTIYNRTRPVGEQLIVTRRMVSGIEQGEALRGSSSAAFLKRIRGRELAKYVYFGGFVGQGNLSAHLTLPSDVDGSDVKDFEMELDVEAPFELFINANPCNTFTPTDIGDNFTPDYWNLSSCKGDLVSGRNTIVLEFDDVNTAYVGGGYIRASYASDDFRETMRLGKTTQQLIGIEGLVNLYDSFIVPGTLRGLDVYLHYHANHSASNNTFYMTIGNETVYSDDVTEDVTTFVIDNATLAGQLDYDAYSRTTVPFRIGFANVTYETSYKGNARVSLITDVSTSMDWEMGSNAGGEERDCDDDEINDSDTQRLSVAKCLDKEFVDEILQYSGNLMGLVSYESVLDSSMALTTNQAALEGEIDDYEPTGSTCICCGLEESENILTDGLKRTEYIAKGAGSWRYETNGFAGPPPDDGDGDAWYARGYDDSAWSSGTAPLGHGSGIATDMGSAASIGALYANLWPHTSDGSDEAVDFDGGEVNTTGDTWGLSGADDGWDSASGQNPYSFDGDSTYDWVQDNDGDNMLHFQFGTGSGDDRNTCSNHDCSGAYGIEIEITPQMYNTIASATGEAIVSFAYDWQPAGSPFESDDELWLKARWTDRSGGEHYLGEELSSEGPDSTVEVDNVNNPNSFFSSQSYAQDVASWIDGPGNYYLDIGAKLRSQCSFGFIICWDDMDKEWGDVYVDDIKLQISNASGSNTYYLRKHFNVADLDDVQSAYLHLLHDDRATIYLNGEEIEQTGDGDGTYWDIIAERFTSGFVSGDNVLAIKLTNAADDARIDANLFGLNTTKLLADLLMTDGVANKCCRYGDSGDTTTFTSCIPGFCCEEWAREDAIEQACAMREEWGITTHAVGYGDQSDPDTLAAIAECGGGEYFTSSDTQDLQDFYSGVASTILEAATPTQNLIVEGDYGESILFNDSYINVTYTPLAEQPKPGELEVVFQTEQFNTCTPTIYIHEGLRLIEAIITSYSGEHWTDLVTANAQVSYNLSGYSINYSRLGDPYRVMIPTDQLVVGADNVLSIRTGDSPDNITGCSKNNSMVYRGFINSSTTRSEVLPRQVGCNWTIEFEDGTTLNTTIPKSYSGTKHCIFNNATGHPAGDYDALDAYDVSVAAILDNLDFDDDGRVLVNLAEEDLEIIVTIINQLPYLWGPTFVELEVWT